MSKPGEGQVNITSRSDKVKSRSGQAHIMVWSRSGQGHVMVRAMSCQGLDQCQVVIRSWARSDNANVITSSDNGQLMVRSR